MGVNRKTAFASILILLLFTLTLQVATAYPAYVVKRTLGKGVGWIRIFVTGVANDSDEPVYAGRLDIYIDNSRVFSFIIDKVIPPRQTLYLGLNVTLQAPSGERCLEVRVYGSGLQIVAQDVSIIYIPYPWEEWIAWLTTPQPLALAPMHGLIMAFIVILVFIAVKRKK